MPNEIDHFDSLYKQIESVREKGADKLLKDETLRLIEVQALCSIASSLASISTNGVQVQE